MDESGGLRTAHRTFDDHQSSRHATSTIPYRSMHSPGADDGTAPLQRRLAQESGERDAAKMALHRLKCSIEAYRQRLRALLARPQGLRADEEVATAQRARELVKDMVAGMRGGWNDDHTLGIGAQALVAPSSPTGGKAKSYEVLRQSLEETQRRCESLNSDMVHQAEANDELVETLGTVKDANRHLLEQIRSQTAEISQLTQQRVADEEKMDQMTRKHESERDILRQDTQRQVAALRDAGADRHSQVYQHLSDKLRHVKTHSEVMMKEVTRLSQEARERRADVANLASQMQGQLQGAERDLSHNCDQPRQLHVEWKAAAKDGIADLHASLQAERAARASENHAWSHKHTALGTDKEHHQGTHPRKVAQLNTKMQSLDRSLAVERHAWHEDRAGLDRRADELQAQKNQHRSGLEQLQRDIVSLETAISAAHSSIASTEQTIVDLKRHSRESDDALAAAVSGNEHLREQMDEQRQRFHEKNETDLHECRSNYEQKLADGRFSHEANVAMAHKQIEAMEVDHKTKEETHNNLQAALDKHHEEVLGHQRDIDMMGAQHEAANVQRDNHEKSLYDAKHHFHGERLKLTHGADQISTHVAHLEDECKRMSSDFADFRRKAAAHETENSTRHAAAEGALKDAQDTLTDIKSRHRDASDHHARTTADAQAQHERHLEHHGNLVRGHEAHTNAANEERHRLMHAYETEKRLSEQVHDEFHNERGKTADSLRRVHDDSRNKLADAERERARVKECCRTDVTQAAQSVQQQQRRLEALDNDLARLTALSRESEQSLVWVREECDREERDAVLALRQLEEEVRTVSHNLDIVRRDELKLEEQMRTWSRSANGIDHANGAVSGRQAPSSAR